LGWAVSHSTYSRGKKDEITAKAIKAADKLKVISKYGAGELEKIYGL